MEGAKEAFNNTPQRHERLTGFESRGDSPLPKENRTPKDGSHKKIRSRGKRGERGINKGFGRFKNG